MLTKVAYVSVVALLLPAFAAGLDSEITTAGIHAKLAAGSSDIQMVQMHLHHTVNCLVGPKGAEFDATNENPCANLGSGAIPDSADAAKIDQLKAALATAEAGIATTDLKVAKQDAANVAAQLTAAK
jgi:hypothetical protein